MIKNDAAFVFNEPSKNKEDKWNKRVDDYENYIKEYIKHYKKALQGNSISLSKYPYMRAKWEVIGMKLDKAKKKELLTNKQIKKVLQIQMKIMHTCCN